jgi:hypothetical protein
MIRLIAFLVYCVVFHQALAEEREHLGLPECELIVGVNRHIEIGNTIAYTTEYMENNKYRCDDFKGKANEIVSCTYRIDHKFEVLLVVENGIVTDIESRYGGAECTYFSVFPPPTGVPDEADVKK